MAIFRLVSCATIEEVIYRKQVFKGALSRAATDAAGHLRYFTRAELREVFKLGDTRRSETQAQLERLHGHQKREQGVPEEVSAATRVLAWMRS